MPTTTIGPMLRRWRTHRRLSQLELSTVAAVSQRHLSHLETGKSRPSREMVLHLAEVLDVPLRERNALLGAAGFAPAYPETPLDHPDLAQVREAIRLLCDHHRPYPAVVVDRTWNLVDANPPASMLVATLVDPSSPAITDPLNVMRLLFHPEGLRRSIVNWDVVGSALWARLRRDAEAAPDDPRLGELVAEVGGWVEATGPLDPASVPDLVVPVHYRTDGLDVSMFSTLASVGSPLDVTVSELSVELFFPADPASAERLAALDPDPRPDPEDDP